MNLLQEIRNRFRPVLARWVVDPDELLAMIRPAQDVRFGDYQANVAMPLGNRLKRPPREIAGELVEQVDLADIAGEVSVAGPGFINIRLDDHFIDGRLLEALTDEARLGVGRVAEPQTIVIDFSSPNVAKPMHVGHIRSTVIGDCLARVLRFLGHRVITDNHLGDWGTQFGMMIYGYKHFRDPDAWQRNPIAESSRLYRQVRQLVDYQAARAQWPDAEASCQRLEDELQRLEKEPPADEQNAAKQQQKHLRQLRTRLAAATDRREGLRQQLSVVENDQRLAELASHHDDIGNAVLQETARLHEGDAENRQLWQQFLDVGSHELRRVYDRLGISFDFELGESFYHDQLGAVVEQLVNAGLARPSEGAVCIFLEGHNAPMIIQKRDGAFLYATSDLATIRYRVETWHPDMILYVVDIRQSEHFDKLFSAARKWGFDQVDFRHISFGTVMGDDGKPFKTRTGDTVGLEALLDEAEHRAWQVVSELDDQKPVPEFDPQQRQRIARVVGISALRYADLSQNRSSDYTFSYDKMVSLKGNTATYLQYGYARVMGIFRKGDIDPLALRRSPVPSEFAEGVERQLAVRLLQFEEVLSDVVVDFRPNLLANYLFELVQLFFVFFDQCPVLKADGALRQSRLQLCDLTARTIRQGLDLMGIEVVERM